ncbi:MAG: UDP-N-acetylmuramate dehydrogenase [Eubacterium sp.]
MKIMHDVDMREYTSFRAGGRADTMAVPESVEDLQKLLQDVHGSGQDYLLLGNGSNTIFRDEGYHGTVIHLGDAFSSVKVEGERLICGSAALISAAAHEAMEHGLSGMEPISGIPGSIGGAVFMNAGAYGGEMKQVIESAQLVSADGQEIHILSNEELQLGYRMSRIQKTGEVVVSVTLKLTPADRADILSAMQEFMQKRNSKQPLQYPSAGSFFKRPEGYFAGKLIQDAGLKGASVGGAQISAKHSGFMINRGGATAGDILKLMHLVQNTVKDRFGVEMEPEVRIVGGPAENDKKEGR